MVHREMLEQMEMPVETDQVQLMDQLVHQAIQALMVHLVIQETLEQLVLVQPQEAQGNLEVQGELVELHQLTTTSLQ